MRCSKNKRKYKRRTRNRYAGQNALNEVKNKSSNAFHSGVADAEGAVHTGVADAEGAVHTGVADAKGAVGKVTNSLSGLFRKVTGKVKDLVPKGGKRRTKRRRSRQRGGAETTEMLGGLTKVMEHINKLAPQLAGALGNVNAHADTLSQMGGKKRRKFSRKGGGDDVFPQDKPEAEDMNAEKDANFVSNPQTESKPESQMENPTKETQENPSEEPEKCTGISKMFGFCQTKDVKAEKQRMKDCIAKCAPPQKTEEKQSGGKVKKSKKKRKKRKNKSYKKRH